MTMFWKSTRGAEKMWDECEYEGNNVRIFDGVSCNNAYIRTYAREPNPSRMAILSRRIENRAGNPTWRKLLHFNLSHLG